MPAAHTNKNYNSFELTLKGLIVGCRLVDKIRKLLVLPSSVKVKEDCEYRNHCITSVNGILRDETDRISKEVQILEIDDYEKSLQG